MASSLIPIPALELSNESDDMNILFLSRWFPWPTNNGSKLRIYNLLRGLAHQHDVTLISFADVGESESDVPELQTICRDVQTVDWRPFQPNSGRAYLGLLQSAPRSIVDTFSAEMRDRIVEMLASRPFDLVIASQVTMAHYGQYFGDVPALYEEVELGVFYEQYSCASNLRSRMRHGLTWSKHRRYLARQLRRFAACTVASSEEKQLLSRAVPDCPPIEVVPNCIELAEYAVVPPTLPDTLVFTGPFGYHANYNAMVWFLRDIYPLVQQEIADIVLTITGDHGGLPLPAAANVTLTGFVDDIRPLVARARVSLAPLLDGGGTRLKILEAMALRTPVVATSKGAEGLEVRDGEHLLIADNATDFASAVVRLCRDDALAGRLAENAYELVRDKYDWSAALPRILALMERVTVGQGAGLEQDIAA